MDSIEEPTSAREHTTDEHNSSMLSNDGSKDSLFLSSAPQDFIEIYMQKCSDYSIQHPISRLIKEYNELMEKG